MCNTMFSDRQRTVSVPMVGIGPYNPSCIRAVLGSNLARDPDYSDKCTKCVHNGTDYTLRIFKRLFIV